MPSNAYSGVSIKPHGLDQQFKDSLKRWILQDREEDSDAFDLQMEADAQAGRLESLWQQALEDIKAGRIKPLDEVLN